MPRAASVTMLCLVALAPVAAPLAAVIDVTTDVDVVDPGDGVISLREAFLIASSNVDDDEIVLQSGVEYTLDSCFVGELPHTAPEALTLTGNGATIFQTCFDKRVIHNTDPLSELNIDNVALTGGFNSGASVEGAALRANGHTTITNSLIGFNNASVNGSVINGGDGTLNPVSLTLIDTHVFNNVGNGVELSFGSVTITNSTVVNHTGRGVNLVDCSPVDVTDTMITGNTAAGLSTTEQGGSIVTLSGVVIDNNDDVGFRCSGCMTIDISDSSISGNGDAPGDFGGGGVLIAYDQDEPADMLSLTITDSFIDENTAERGGGGIRVQILESSAPAAPPAQNVLIGTSVSRNTTVGASNIDGGGIYVETGDLTVSGSTVDDNLAGPLGGFTAAKGGGIYLKEAGVLDEAPELAVDNSSVSGNRANWQGGGIWVVSEGSVDITDSVLSGNQADALGGGALYNSGSQVSIRRSTIDHNSADTGGGVAIAEFSGFAPGSLKIEDSTLSNNSASFAASGGGGLFVNVGDGGVNAIVENSTVTHNDSANLGGGILVIQTSSLTLSHATVVDNSGSNGSNLFVAAGNLDTTATVIALPQGGGENCDLGGGSLSGGFNYSDDATCGLGVMDTVSTSDPLLGPLQDNGGPTLTREPAELSPLLNTVPARSCQLSADQRGSVRPVGIGCDTGAVELNLNFQSALAFADFVGAAGLAQTGVTTTTRTEDGTVLRLTASENGQAGSAFWDLPVELARGFSTFFSFRMTDPQGMDEPAFPGCAGTNGGDGMTFTVHDDPAGPGALGSGGLGLGYSGISNSVAVELDTFCNSPKAGNLGDPSSNHAGIDFGTTDHNAAGNGPVVDVPSPEFGDGEIRYAWVDYDGATTVGVHVSADPVRPPGPTLSGTVDLIDLVGLTGFVGFTASTGLASENHDILSWEFCSTGAVLGQEILGRRYCSADPPLACMQGSDCPEGTCLKGAFEWRNPVGFSYVVGEFETSSDIASYGFFLVSPGFDDLVSDASTPTPGRGFWYLIKPVCPETGTSTSWQTVPGAEPARDATLP